MSWCISNSQENDLKRARALKKTKVERELCREKDAEIQRQVHTDRSWLYTMVGILQAELRD